MFVDQHVVNPGTKTSDVARIEGELKVLAARDLQLWSIVILTMLLFAGGFMSFVLPNVAWGHRVMVVDTQYLPQLFFGLIVLVVLFNIYLVGQKHTINASRRELLHQLVANNGVDDLSSIDPLTQLPTRRYLEHVLPRDIARSNRLGNPLSILLVRLGKFDNKNRLAEQVREQVLLEFSKIMLATFRGADLACRTGELEFAVAMPDTSETQAEFPVQRLTREVELWNLNTKLRCELSFNWAVSSYVTGETPQELLGRVERSLSSKKSRLPFLAEITHAKQDAERLHDDHRTSIGSK